ncbi:MAG: ACT domain-containing protein [Deltaproteobacteria bacterium]|nr:ACT domain-containing protein [Deltaproteobacteria bacterium]
MYKKLQISAFVKNSPGELFKLCQVMHQAGVNILAMSIQNASSYLMELFKTREQTGRRIATSSSYGSVMKDTEDRSVIRIVVDKAEAAVEAIKAADYAYNTSDVLILELENRPGTLGELAGRFGEASININYVYGSSLEDDKKAMYVFHLPNVDEALEQLKNLPGKC